MGLLLTRSKFQTLKHACPEFDERDAIAHIKSCDACHLAVLKSSRFGAWKKAAITDVERLRRLTRKEGR